MNRSLVTAVTSEGSHSPPASSSAVPQLRSGLFIRQCYEPDSPLWVFFSLDKFKFSALA